MSIYNSKVVTSKQTGVHENLRKYLSRYSIANYQRPVREFTLDNMKTITEWLQGDSFILDLCCGIGESSYKLNEISGKKVIGVDKSISRINRQNSFKVQNESVLLVRDDVFDLIPKMYENLKDQIIEVHIYYPNPWPKNTHLKRRLHANPVAPFLFGLTDKFVLRSNWEIYLKEFAFAADYFLNIKKEPRHITKLDSFITPFEKKYYLSGQKIYELNIF